MSIGEGLLQGILGGVAGGAGQILQRNQMMDKEDEQGRLEQLRAQIQEDRQKAILDYTAAKQAEVEDRKRREVADVINSTNKRTPDAATSQLLDQERGLSSDDKAVWRGEVGDETEGKFSIKPGSPSEQYDALMAKGMIKEANDLQSGRKMSAYMDSLQANADSNRMRAEGSLLKGVLGGGARAKSGGLDFGKINEKITKQMGDDIVGADGQKVPVNTNDLVHLNNYARSYIDTNMRAGKNADPDNIIAIVRAQYAQGGMEAVAKAYQLFEEQTAKNFGAEGKAEKKPESEQKPKTSQESGVANQDVPKQKAAWQTEQKPKPQTNEGTALSRIQNIQSKSVGRASELIENVANFVDSGNATSSERALIEVISSNQIPSDKLIRDILSNPKSSQAARQLAEQYN